MRSHPSPSSAPAPPLHLLILLGLLALPGLASGQTALDRGDAGDGSPEAAWRTLAEVRDSLVESGPTRASFTQTYIPAGFSTGDQESGTLSIHLPDCLRWDYTEPYPKSFLLCGETAHLWNPEDGTGRRYSVDREREPGLDLVLLGIDELKHRYRVASEDGEQGRRAVRLAPLGDTARRDAGPTASGEVVIQEATLVVDPESDRLVTLSYRDDEGNVTRFEIGDYRAIDTQGVFSPPGDIEWTEEEP